MNPSLRDSDKCHYLQKSPPGAAALNPLLPSLREPPRERWFSERGPPRRLCALNPAFRASALPAIPQDGHGFDQRDSWIGEASRNSALPYVASPQFRASRNSQKKLSKSSQKAPKSSQTALQALKSSKKLLKALKSLKKPSKSSPRVRGQTLDIVKKLDDSSKKLSKSSQKLSKCSHKALQALTSSKKLLKSSKSPQKALHEFVDKPWTLSKSSTTAPKSS